MTPLLLRMLLPLTMLAATGIPADPACAAAGNGDCGRESATKPVKPVGAQAGVKLEVRARLEML